MTPVGSHPIASWLELGAGGVHYTFMCVRCVHVQLRDSAGAILELHRALELAPDDVKYRVLRAAAYRQEVGPAFRWRTAARMCVCH